MAWKKVTYTLGRELKVMIFSLDLTSTFKKDLEKFSPKIEGVSRRAGLEYWMGIGVNHGFWLVKTP